MTAATATPDSQLHATSRCRTGGHEHLRDEDEPDVGRDADGEQRDVAAAEHVRLPEDQADERRAGEVPEHERGDAEAERSRARCAA